MYINKINHRLQEENEYVKKKIKQGSRICMCRHIGSRGSRSRKYSLRGPVLQGIKPVSYTHLHDTGTGAFDLNFTARELTYMAGLGVPVYCGIEVNSNEAAPSNPGYLRETMEGVRHGWEPGRGPWVSGPRTGC